VIPALARFAELLRREGVAASPAELVDASRAVEGIGFEDRARFRAALRATLAKSRRSQAAFERAFDAFFVPPPRAPKEGQGKRPGAAPGGDRQSGSTSAPKAGARPRPPEDAEEKGRGRRDDVEPRERMRRALEAARFRVERRAGRLRRAPARREIL
jgi:uncharacterized protein with von Willebrand factor type A (vWA) domain